MKPVFRLEVILLLAVFGLGSPTLFAQRVQLPTPEAAFHDYDPEAESKRLIQNIMSDLDPAKRIEVMRMAAMLTGQGAGQISSDEIRSFLDVIHWEKYRGRILRLLIYRSGVFDVFEGGFGKWLRVVHDFLLFFLDQMPEERLVERIVGQLKLRKIDDREKDPGPNREHSIAPEAWPDSGALSRSPLGDATLSPAAREQYPDTSA